MPRIRTIKPSFFTSTTVAELPIEARLTFIGLWTYVDDDGRAVDDPRLVKAAIWPLDDRRNATAIEKDLAVLAKRGFIERYTHDSHRYLRVRAWRDHQRINRPQPSRLPRSPEETASETHDTADENSVTTHAPFTDDAVNAHGTRTEPSPPERKGKERNPHLHLLVSQQGQARDCSEMEIRKATTIAERIADTITAAGGRPPDPADIAGVVWWAADALDLNVVDEAVGNCSKAKSLNYVATTLRSWAGQRDIDLPEWRPQP